MQLEVCGLRCDLSPSRWSCQRPQRTAPPGASSLKNAGSSVAPPRQAASKCRAWPIVSACMASRLSSATAPEPAMSSAGAVQACSPSQLAASTRSCWRMLASCSGKRPQSGALLFRGAQAGPSSITFERGALAVPGEVCPPGPTRPEPPGSCGSWLLSMSLDTAAPNCCARSASKSSQTDSAGRVAAALLMLPWKLLGAGVTAGTRLSALPCCHGAEGLLFTPPAGGVRVALGGCGWCTSPARGLWTFPVALSPSKLSSSNS